MPSGVYVNPYTPETPVGAGLQNIAMALFGRKAAEARRNLYDQQGSMYDAHSELYREQAAKARTERKLAERTLTDQGPDAQDELIAASAGVPIYTVRGYRDTLAGTNPGRTVEDYADVAPGIRRSMLAVRPAYADKTINPVNIADALDRLDRTDTRNDVVSGKKDARRVAQAFFAVSGHAPFSGSETGSTNLLTGDQTLNEVGTGRAERERQTAFEHQQRGRGLKLEADSGVRLGPPVVVRDPEAGDIFTAPSSAIGRTPGLNPNSAGARPVGSRGADGSTTTTEIAPLKATNQDMSLLLGGIDRAVGGQLADQILQGAVLDRAQKYFSTPGSAHYGQHEAASRAAVADILPHGAKQNWGFGKYTANGEPVLNAGPVPITAPTTRSKTVSRTPGGAATGRTQQPTVGGALPAEAAAKLKEGVQTTFSNGQVWMLLDGVPKRVK
jgi:hypothetical protein